VAAVTSSLNSFDFVSLGQLPSGTVTVLAGQRTATFTVQIATDTDHEAAETFRVTLGNPSVGLILQQSSSSVTILNDDMQFLTGADEVFTGTALGDLVDGLFGNDALSGLGGADLLIGGVGRDTLYGGSENDTLLGGAGSDQLFGDAGVDTVSYEVTTTGVDASLVKSLSRSAQEGTDRLDGIENLIGGSGDDTLTGDTAANQLTGLAGNDMLDGGAGNDTLTGSAGNDTYVLDVAGDVVVELADQGMDRIISQATYTLSANVEELELAGVSVINGTGNALDNLLLGSRRENQLLGEAGNDTLMGMDGKDTLFGGNGTDLLTGGTGVDRLFGGLGNDTLVGEAADAVLDGGENNDILQLASRFVSASDAQIINIETVTLTQSGIIMSLVRQTEAFTINGFANGTSTIVAGAGADTIIGGRGADSLAGGEGADSLIGGQGDDTVVGDQADVLIDGGAGNDVLQVAANFTAATDAQVINMQVVTMIATGLTLDLTSQTEALILNAFATGASSILGTSGADTIFGGTGADSLMGGIGNDVLVGGQTDILLDGGTGTDTLALVGNFTSVTDAQIANVEAVSLAADGLTLNLSNQTEGFTLNGWADGVSTIVGGAGVDLLIGGLGADSLTGGQGADSLYGADGADSLYGGEGNDTLIGAQSDAVLEGGAGNDVLQLGAAFTSVSNGQLATVEVVTLTATALSLDLSNQTEGFTLNGFATGASTITGGDEADSIVGGSGADSLTGGAGADSLTGGAGADSLTGGAGADSLTGGAGADSFVFISLTGVDSLTDFTSGSDKIWLDTAVMTALGASGTLSLDAFYSGAGAVSGNDATDRIIHDTTTGALYYDADGSGGEAAVQFAILTGAPSLRFDDFLIV
jgi:Ca2+-binding RTX toxin-like protein